MTTRLSFHPVALDFMNRDHAAFAEIHEALVDMLAKGVPYDRVDSALDELLRHTRAHFAAEERMMIETGFPAYPVHKGEHERVLAEMSEQIEHWTRGRDAKAFGDWMRLTLADWFVTHVASMDLMTSRFVVAAADRQ